MGLLVGPFQFSTMKLLTPKAETQKHTAAMDARSDTELAIWARPGRHSVYQDLLQSGRKQSAVMELAEAETGTHA